jgi:AraC-like DNA-binding protein
MPLVEFHRIRYEAGRRMEAHIDACRRLSVVLRGELREAHGSSETGARVGSVGLKAAELVHDNRFGARGAEIFSVVLEDRLLEDLDVPCDLEAWGWHHAGEDRSAGLALAAAAARGERLGVEEALLCVIAGFRSDRRRGESPAVDSQVHQLRDRLHDDPDGEISLRALAREFGLHPVTLGTHFRRAYGCSITAYRQRLRAERAALALAAAGPSLSEVALEQGFYDLSHLTRVFRREFGLSPGRFRRALAPRPEGLQSSKTSWTLAL